MSTTLITPINFDKICRICLTESVEMHSLFSVLDRENRGYGDLTYIYEILMNISSIKILSEDRLPANLCTTCLELANTSYKFQQQCNRSQAILETYLTQVNTERALESDESNSSFDLTIDCRKVVDTDFFEVSKDDNADTINIVKEDIEESHIKFERSDECESNACKLPNEKISDETILEDNRLKTKLSVRRMQDENVENNNFSKQRKKLNYYVKTAEKVSKGYACFLCDKTYKFRSSLKVHMRNHTLERPYICTVCGKDFNHHCSFTYHLRSHSGEQPYKCKLCGKQYKQSGSLTTHMRVHTGQRPFLCSVCGRGFRQAPDLGYHMRTHTKEKPYMCNICGKTMSMQCHLVQHMRTHTGERPFKCAECDKAFPSSTRLKRHAIIHTGLKPYKCEVCDRSFNRKSTLRVHAKIHTDERPHVCTLCGKGFIQSHSLKLHVLTHTTPTSIDST